MICSKNLYVKKTLEGVSKKEILFMKLNKSFLILIFYTVFLLLLLAQTKPSKIHLSTGESINSSLATTQNYYAHTENFPNQQELIVTLYSPSKKWGSESICLLRERVKSLQHEFSFMTESLTPFDLRRVSFSKDRLFYPKTLDKNCNNYKHEVFQRFFDKSKQTILLSFKFQFDEHPQYGHFHPQEFDSEISLIEKAFSNWDIKFSGNLMFEKELARAMSNFLFVQILFALVAVFGFWIFFRSFKSSFLFAVSLFCTFIPIKFLMSVFEIPQDAFISCLFLVLTLSTLEDFIFLAYGQSCIQKKSHNKAFEKVYLTYRWPSFMTSLTTVIGFSSLLISKVYSLQYFGALAAVGASLQWINTLFVLPLFIRAFPYFRVWSHKTALLGFTSQISSWTFPKRRGQVLGGIIFVISLLGVFNLNLNDRPLELFDKNTSFRKGVDSVVKVMGGSAQVDLSFSTQSSKEDRRHITQQIRSLPNVVSVETFEDFVKIDAMSETMQNLILREARSSSFGKLFFGQKNGAERAQLLIEQFSFKKMNTLTKQVKDICQNLCTLNGELVAFFSHSKEVLRGLGLGILWGFAMVSLVIFILLKTFGMDRFFHYAYCALWGPVVIFGIIALTQFPVNTMSAILGSIAIGLAGDNCIQFLFASRLKKDGPKNLAPVSLICALIMSLASLSFLVSDIEHFRQLGLLLSCLFALGFLGDVFLLRTHLK